MSGIIKAGQMSGKGRGMQWALFNFGDMSDKAQSYLDGVRQEATKIIAQANHEAEMLRNKAREQGKQVAREAAEATIRSKVEQQMQSVLPALEQAVESIHRAKQDWLNHWEKSAVALSAAIAQCVVRRELKQSPEITKVFIREALELATGSDQIKLHLNPHDYEALGFEVQQLTKQLGVLAETEIVSDSDTTQGGCRVITEFGEIDQQIETQIKRIEKELT